MTARERVLATINRKPTDRIPVDVWVTPEVLDALRAHTGVQDELEVYQKLGVDKIVWTFPGYGKSDNFFDPNVVGNLNTWGVPTKKVISGAATYYENLEPPLGNFDDPAQLDDYPLWPDPDKLDYAGAKVLAVRAREFGFATIGPWISHFEIYCMMRGLENSFMDLIGEPDFLTAALARIHDVQMKMLERHMNELGDLLDMVFISDDMGSQQGLFMSLDVWDRFFRDHLTEYCDLIHRHGKKVLYHSDGAAHDLIPRLIECGIDILNPIQHVCTGMDCSGLKREFGDKVIFHGGVENQSILPFGTPADVRREVLECIDTLGKGGGYIPCSCHNIQAGTPVENVLALIETVKSASLS